MSDLILSTVSWPRFMLRVTINTWAAPSMTACLATAYPMPEVPPVKKMLRLTQRLPDAAFAGLKGSTGQRGSANGLETAIDP